MRGMATALSLGATLLAAPTVWSFECYRPPAQQIARSDVIFSGRVTWGTRKVGPDHRVASLRIERLYKAPAALRRRLRPGRVVRLHGCIGPKCGRRLRFGRRYLVSAFVMGRTVHDHGSCGLTQRLQPRPDARQQLLLRALDQLPPPGAPRPKGPTRQKRPSKTVH